MNALRTKSKAISSYLVRPNRALGCTNVSRQANVNVNVNVSVNMNVNAKLNLAVASSSSSSLSASNWMDRRSFASSSAAASAAASAATSAAASSSSKGTKDKGKLVLLYSGGLDTSCVLKWLLDQGYDVIPLICNIGQYGEDFEASKQKAEKIGASKVYVEDIREDFLRDYVYPSLSMNGIYEDRYLMGTSLARYPIAKKAIDIALSEGAVAVGHGATGKGNDQVRFEMSMLALAPHLKMVVPWRDPEFFTRFEGRRDLIEYAKQTGIPVTQTKAKPYSCDENIMHISYESGVLEDPWETPPSDMWVMTKDVKDGAASESDNLAISFEDGIPVKVEYAGTTVTGTVPMFDALNDLGMKHGIGRIDVVENRFVGMKSRGAYETPGATILREAHLDIEAMAMDREVRRVRDMLSLKFADLAYNGFWFSPEMEFILHAGKKAQERVTGDVKIGLYRGNVQILGRRSPFSLYDKDLVSMDEGGGWNPSDAEGFIKINSVRLRNYYALLEKHGLRKKN